MISDYTPLKIEDFKGIFDRGANDSCPPDHAVLARNTSFIPKGFKTRPGTVSHFSESGVVQRFHVVKLGNVDRLLILVAPGNIYDSYTNQVIFSKNGLTDFNCTTFLGRVYLTVHDGNAGLANEFVYVYTGSGTAKKIGGTAPSNTFTAGNGTPGYVFVEAGVHLLAMVYETNTGFVTSPGPTGMLGEFTPVTYTAPGDKIIALTNIQVGGSDIVLKHFLATKAGLLEFFFVPNGTIINSLTSTQIGFTDAMLVDSADYLFDVKSQIPAGLGITEYAGRLVVYGFPSPDGSLVRVSRVGEPEVFNDADNVVSVDRDSQRSVTGAFDLRGILYLTKNPGVYGVSDNGLEPSEWGAPIIIDNGVGTTVYGSATVLDKTGSTADKVLVADKSGLLLFDGVFRRPELTWKVRDIWNQITNAARATLQVAIDPIQELIYVSIPRNANSPNYLLVGDYTEGLNHANIKWSLWDVIYRDFKCIGLSDLGENLYSLKFGSSFNIFRFDSLIVTDVGYDIPTEYHTGYLTPDDKIGGINFFGAVRIRGFGTSILDCYLSGEPISDIKHFAPISLSAYPAREYLERTNYQAEKVVLSITSVTGTMEIYKAILFARPLWGVRPSI